MGLPEIIIEFKTKGVTAIKRSARGIVAIVLKDDTEEGQALNIYKSVLDVDPTHFTARNYEYLKLVYEGSPSKTIVLKVATTEENLNPQLKQLNDLKWNYLSSLGSPRMKRPRWPPGSRRRETITTRPSRRCCPTARATTRASST